MDKNYQIFIESKMDETMFKNVQRDYLKTIDNLIKCWENNNIHSIKAIIDLYIERLIVDYNRESPAKIYRQIIRTLSRKINVPPIMIDYTILSF